MSRTGMQSEEDTFEYDALDRLVGVKTGNTTTLNISYANNGNITSKTDVGNYTYSSIKPHAVMKIDNASAYQYTSDMSTEYNDMGRIKLISQRQTYPINMSFAYGADGSLWNLDYTPSVRSTDIGEHRAWSRYYDDNYEYLYSRVYQREFYYLNDHVIAVRDKEKDFKYYVVAKDNLGSIVGIYDANGNKVFSASYDAWGKQTVSSTKDDMDLMLRGYCGHTMLNEFDLIDMKGRLYDPVVGRFLSPDNYVQTPDNSQNFNRYSYCLNNPLKYTDPSGELFGLDDALVVGVAFGAITGAMNAQMAERPIWKGALAGGLSSLASYGIGGLFGHGLGPLGNELLRSGAHGLTSGALNWLNGESFRLGMFSGFASSLAGSGAQALGFGPDGVLTAAAIAGGLASYSVGGSFRSGLGVGMTVGTFNHTGGDVKTIERTLPPVYVVAKDLSYRKTFGYWLLGVGSGVSSGIYKMWNPDAFGMSIGAGIQIGPFAYSGSVGWLTNGSHAGLFVTGTSGASTQAGISVDVHATFDFYKKVETRPLALDFYAGKGMEYSGEIGKVAVSYGGPETMKHFYDSDFYYIGIGAVASGGLTIPGCGASGCISQTWFKYCY